MRPRSKPPKTRQTLTIVLDQIKVRHCQQSVTDNLRETATQLHFRPLLPTQRVPAPWAQQDHRKSVIGRAQSFRCRKGAQADRGIQSRLARRESGSRIRARAYPSPEPSAAGAGRGVYQEAKGEPCIADKCLTHRAILPRYMPRSMPTTPNCSIPP